MMVNDQTDCVIVLQPDVTLKVLNKSVSKRLQRYVVIQLYFLSICVYCPELLMHDKLLR